MPWRIGALWWCCGSEKTWVGLLGWSRDLIRVTVATTRKAVWLWHKSKIDVWCCHSAWVPLIKTGHPQRWSAKVMMISVVFLAEVRCPSPPLKRERWPRRQWSALVTKSPTYSGSPRSQKSGTARDRREHGCGPSPSLVILAFSPLFFHLFSPHHFHQYISHQAKMWDRVSCGQSPEHPWLGWLVKAIQWPTGQRTGDYPRSWSRV